MRFGKFVYIIVPLLLAPATAARAQQASCSIDIKAPAANARVGSTEEVAGSAVIPPGTKLWVFARLKGLGVWWPQGGGSVDIDSQGRWKVTAYFGLPRDIGKEFEVSARVFESSENSKLEQWVQKAADTGQYPGIPMPTFIPGCSLRPSIVVVTKSS